MMYSLSEDRIREQLDSYSRILVNGILEYSDKLPYAIYLVGGYGRGEGAWYEDDKGLHPFNDFDLAVITDAPLDYEKNEALRKKLAKAVNIKWVDIDYYSNPKVDERDCRTFTQIKDVYNKVKEMLDKSGLKVYVSGGSVPYLLTGKDSGRFHDDIDTVCRMEDIGKLRQAFMAAGYYDADWDSRNFSQDGKDYGFEMKIDGVPFGIYPFEYDHENGLLTQYSADPYIKTCKVKTAPIKELNDYVTSYTGSDGRVYDTMSLECIKLTKDNAKRSKDIADSKVIEETGLLRPEVSARLQMYTETVEGKKTL